MALDPAEERRRKRKRFAPIFPVHDLTASLAFYGRLGFRTRTYDDGYGFATLHQAEIHLGVVPHGSSPTPSSAYLFVADADEVAQKWASAGVEVRAPQDTEWRMHEGVVIDPDGNIIRFGSPLEEGEE